MTPGYAAPVAMVAAVLLTAAIVNRRRQHHFRRLLAAANDLDRLPFPALVRALRDTTRACRVLARRAPESSSLRTAARERTATNREILGAHPLRDDLVRAIEATESLLAAAVTELGNGDLGGGAEVHRDRTLDWPSLLRRVQARGEWAQGEARSTPTMHTSS